MNPAAGNSTIRDIDLGCRAGFLVMTAVLAYVALRLSWVLWNNPISKIYEAMLKGQSLPLSTRIADQGAESWLSLSLALTALAIVAGLKMRRPLHALLTIAACNLALVVVSIFLATALFSPVATIVRSLQ